MKDYDLDLKTMLDHFKEQILNKEGMDFKKQIMVNQVIYVIRMKMSYNEAGFSVIIYPNIDKDESDPHEFEKISDCLFKREILNEEQFIEMLREVY